MKGFRKHKGTRGATGLMRIISESVLAIKKKIACILLRLAKGF